jgi:hypothetical protein
LETLWKTLRELQNSLPQPDCPLIKHILLSVYSLLQEALGTIEESGYGFRQAIYRISRIKIKD